jgi:hypothetical protein
MFYCVWCTHAAHFLHLSCTALPRAPLTLIHRVVRYFLTLPSCLGHSHPCPAHSPFPTSCGCSVSPSHPCLPCPPSPACQALTFPYMGKHTAQIPHPLSPLGAHCPVEGEGGECRVTVRASRVGEGRGNGGPPPLSFCTFGWWAMGGRNMWEVLRYAR